MNKNSRSRVDAEAKEGLPEVKNQVPENKLQTTQQVADTDSALEVKPAESSFTAKRTKSKGATLKQQAIADVITGSSSSAGMGINAAGRGVSGTAGGILGANNSTPVANKSRSETRVGKKLDRLATKLNFTPCEQVIVDMDESKPLADAATEDQGYNGTYRNETARSQKIMGAVPGDLMFQRSVDLITKDKLYFVEGQQVFQVADDKTGFNPSKSEFGGQHDVTYHSGNFLHRDLRFGLNREGKVKYFYANVEDLTPSGVVDAETANTSSAARLIKANVAELDRQVMDTKAGDEKADLWSPLGRAVFEPTNTAYLMSSIEADTGAYVYLAYSKATTNFSYQLNRGPKDGLSEVTPAIEQCVGWRRTDNNNLDIGSAYSGTLSNVFDDIEYDLGDPSLMIEAYDSINKYKNKADLLLQPRGWRMHLQTADNNMNPLRVPSQFAQVFSGQEVFSTIDHEYDPTLPICMTDKANLITVHNFNELAGFIKLPHFTLSATYSNLESTYKYKSETVIPKGLIAALGYEHLYILEKHSEGRDAPTYSSGVIAFGSDDPLASATNEVEIIISTKNSATGYTLLGTVNDNDAFDVVLHMPIVQSGDDGVVTAVSYKEEYIDAIFHKDAGPFSYSYDDLRNNYIVDVRHPLIDGIIEYLNNSIGGKFRQLLGDRHELYIPLVFSTQYMTLAQILICAATPWIARVRLNAMKDVIYYEDNIGQYPYSKLDTLKNVPFHNYVNFGFTGYDEPLEAKIMNPVVALQWIMPEFFWKVGSSKYVLPWYFNENELNSDGSVNLDASAMSFPSIRSGIRMGALDTLYGMSEKDVRLSLDRLNKILLAKSTINVWKAYKYGRTTDGQIYVELGSSDVFSMFDVLSCPRELGLCMDAPSKLFKISSAHVPEALTSEFASSMAIKIWTNNNTIIAPSILSADGVNINRAANYAQKWISLNADTANSDTVIAGLVFGMNDEGAATFKPFAALSDGAQYDSAPDIISLQRSLWTRLQTLPFVISPFDGHATSGAGVRDIYDIAYMLGLAGFRASDYRESVYNREKEVVNQGLLFVNDPWVDASPIVRNGALSTGVSVTKGYEVKRS